MSSTKKYRLLTYILIGFVIFAAFVIEVSKSHWHKESAVVSINTTTPPTHAIKTCPYYEDPLKPHFYIVKVGFTGIFFPYFCSKNIDRGYSLEPPQRGGSNVYPRSMFWAKISKILHFFHLKITIFIAVKYCSILHGDVCVMHTHIEGLRRDSAGFGIVTRSLPLSVSLSIILQVTHQVIWIHGPLGAGE